MTGHDDLLMIADRIACADERWRAVRLALASDESEEPEHGDWLGAVTADVARVVGDEMAVIYVRRTLRADLLALAAKSGIPLSEMGDALDGLDAAMVVLLREMRARPRDGEVCA